MTSPMQPDDESPLLVPVRTVAKLLQVSPRTVWRLLSAGKLIAPRRIGNIVRWQVEELKAWIAGGCPEPGA
jgi:excisionase family DNA binding protein